MIPDEPSAHVLTSELHALLTRNDLVGGNHVIASHSLLLAGDCRAFAMLAPGAVAVQELSVKFGVML